jgi:hypothetical protein
LCPFSLHQKFNPFFSSLTGVVAVGLFADDTQLGSTGGQFGLFKGYKL